jgi:predicted Holliday junction resolvase-like endonuclease
MIEWIVAGLLLILVLYLAWQNARLQRQVERRARAIFDEWRDGELQRLADERAQIIFRDWQMNEEKRIRKDAAARSEAVIRGRVTEHLIPYFPDFPYNPKDARFLGTPIDFIVFDGLSDGEVKSVAFVEVKTGKTPNLSPREKAVRECIEGRRITYEVLHRRWVE